MAADAKQVEAEVPLPRGEIVAGTVVAQETGKPIPGVRVCYESEADRRRPGPLIARSGLSDEQGRFRLAVPSGKGKLVFLGPWDDEDPASKPRMPSLPEWAPDPRPVKPLNVVEKQAVPEIRFGLRCSLVVDGRVLDPEGKPVAGAEVRRLDALGRRRTPIEARTDLSGRFTLSESPTADSQLDLLIVHRERKLKARLSIPGPFGEKPGSTIPWRIELNPAGTVSGRVTEGANPAAGVPVYLFEHVKTENMEGHTVLDVVRTDQDGRFTFSVVEIGKEHRLDLTAYFPLPDPKESPEKKVAPQVQLQSGQHEVRIVLDANRATGGR